MCAIELLEIHPSSVGSNHTIDSVTVKLRRHVALTTNQNSLHLCVIKCLTYFQATVAQQAGGFN